MRKIYNTDWFKNRIKETHPNDCNDYVLKSEYVNNHTPVTFYHKKCKKYITITPLSFMSGKGCRECGLKRGAHKQMATKEDIAKTIPAYIHIVGPYKGMLYPCKVHCDKCGNTYMVRIHDLKRRQRCAYCTGRKRESTETFSKEVQCLTNGEYSLIGEYTKANDYVKIKHLKCGTIYEVTPHNFKKGKRCPVCRKSIGESIIKNILEDNMIDYESPKKFNDLYIEALLHYDFYLPKYNILIEYQGEQHYFPVEHFGGIKKFEKQKEHDELKRKYALDNNYMLLEIPYKVKTYKSIRNYIDTAIKQNIGKPRV